MPRRFHTSQSDYLLLPSAILILLASVSPATGALSTSSSNLTHVLSVLTYNLPAFSASSTSFIAVPFVCYALFVGCTSTFAGNLLLPFRAHGSETSVRSASALAVCVIVIFFSISIVDGVKISVHVVRSAFR